MNISTKMRKIMMLSLGGLILIWVVNLIVQNLNPEVAKPTLIEYTTTAPSNTYAAFLQSHDTTYNNDQNHTFPASSFILEPGEAISVGGFYDWIDPTRIQIELSGMTSGLYQVWLTYQANPDNYLPIVLSMTIDGVLPYQEATQGSLDTYWVEADDTVRQDRYGNDVSVLKATYDDFIRKTLKDPNRLYTEGLLVYLTPANLTLELEKISGALKLQAIELSPLQALPTYAEYLPNGSMVEVGNHRFEAEDMFLMNHSSITRGISKDIGVLPFSISKLKLNVLGTENYQEPGDAVSWVVDIDQPGYYMLTFKVQQNRQKTTSYRTLYINGEIPFEEAKHLPFGFSRNWQNVTLSSFEDEPYLFYLEPGDIITLEVDSRLFIDIGRKMRMISDEMTQFGLEVTKLTRNNVDKSIDWDMIAYFPDIYTRLESWTFGLTEVIDALDQLYGYRGDSKTVSDLKAARSKIQTLIKDIDEIPRRLTLLSTGSSSAVTLISGQIDVVLQQPLVMDAFFLHGNHNLPRANARFFQSLVIGVQRFFASFINPSYSEGVAPDEIEVWVNRSRQYVDLIQRITDGVFTEQTGIKVKVSIMNDDGKLLLANSADKQPDVALGVSAWIPNDYGMRGMLVDLSTMPGFEQTLKVYNPEQVVPMIYDNQLFGLPETENFYVLVYRKDILDQLELSVPNTWDDVLSMLPILERYGMSFYVPLSNNSSLKSFDTTAPFIFQFGGQLYAEDGLSAAIDNENTIQAMTFMADLYREYSLSYQVPSFFNSFRYGKIPVGIADFGMYLQLLNAASEIKGLWDIALVPGVERDGEIHRDMPGAQQASILFKKSQKQDDAWQFMQWWHSTETQVLFSNTLINTLGTRYLWNTANLEAFEQLNWNKAHQAVILEQWTHLREVPKIPGSYMVERELSNTLNSVVFYDANLRSTMTDSILKMNKEISRKMLEFGYINQRGESLKPFIIPNREIVEGWVNDHE